MVSSPGGYVMQLLPSLALNVHGGIRRGMCRFFVWLHGGGLLGWAGKCALKWQGERLAGPPLIQGDKSIKRLYES